VSAPAGTVGVGIDVGATKILAGAVTSDGAVLEVARVSSPARAEDLAGVLQGAVDSLLSSLGGRAADCAGLGLALPGLVTPEGVLRAAPNLGAADVDIALGPRFGEPLSATLSERGGSVDGGPAYDNDATCAAYAEAKVGGAAGAGDVVVISIGTGIGAGIVSDGRVLRGGHGYAGELGHAVVAAGGIECSCGRRGCWERYASGPALAALAAANAAFAAGRDGSGRDGALRAEDVVGAAREGDAIAATIIEEFARGVALGLANVVEYLDPSRIVLGGGLMQAADVLLEPIRRAYVAETRPAYQRDGSDLVLATLGEEAALIGAALLGLDRLGS